MIPRYRAWNKKFKAMHEVNDIIAISFEDKSICVQTIHFGQGLPDSFEQGLPNSRDLDYYDFDDIVLMQSTGLFDKNGKEVYEGDIVKFSDCDGDGYTVPVVWNNDYACFSVDWGSNMLSSFDYLYLEEFYTDIKDIEVVGNIYENPGLLGGK